MQCYYGYFSGFVHAWLFNVLTFVIGVCMHTFVDDIALSALKFMQHLAKIFLNDLFYCHEYYGGFYC